MTLLAGTPRKYVTIVFLVTILICSSGLIRAQGVVSVDPTENHVSAQADTDIVAELDAAPSTPDITNFLAYGQHHGVIVGSYSSGVYSITLDPISDFLAGEIVTTTVTSGMLSDGVPVEPFVWQFRAAAATSSGAFADSGQTLGPLTSYNHATGDVDEDGDVDAILLNYSTGILVFLNDGLGTLSDSGQLLGVTAPYCAGLADVDGDQDLDLFGCSYSGGNSVWMNYGFGTFIDSGQSLGSSHSVNVRLFDLDGDGDVDAFVRNQSEPDKVWFNDGTGTFTDSGQLLANFNHSYGLDLGDIDGDGDLDMFAAVFMNGLPDFLYFNDGTGIFGLSTGQILGAEWSAAVRMGDLDGDGDLDAFVANYYAGNRVWLNNGIGILSDSGQVIGSSNSIKVDLGDVDGDGDLDAVVGNDATPNKLWLNDGSAMFSDSGQSFYSASCYGVGIVDLNGDGALDVLSVSSGGPSYVWLNEVLIDPLVFEDGFESGDTSEWSFSSDSG